MKVFLMHRDRDWRPEQTPRPSRQTAEQEVDNVLGMYRDRDMASRLEPAGDQQAFVQELELSTLSDAMAGGDRFLLGVNKQAVLAGLDSPEEMRFRQDVLRDCIKNGAVVREIYHLPIEAIATKQKNWMGIFSQQPTGILTGAVQLLVMFVGLLKKLRRIGDEHAHEFESEGFRRFFDTIARELDDEYFAEVDAHLKALQFRSGVLLSATLGQGNEGTDYVLRKPRGRQQHWVKEVLAPRSPVYTFTIPPRDEYRARALGELRDRGINEVANAVAQSSDHIDSFFKMLRTELAFYLGCLNLYERLSELGEPVAIPTVAEPDERRHAFTGLYDVCLALAMGQKVVGNDVNADGKDLVIITGANQGGKSTFLRSIGLAQIMMQCGMFVGAESFAAKACAGLYTHYRREEDASMRSGKLDEELGRMSAIVGAIRPNCLVLFNESFAATNEREGSEIARQIVTALLDKRIEVFFVTHQYEFARSMHDRGLPNALFLRAERLPDGTRTFRQVEGEPLETSYGRDLYHRVFEAGDAEPAVEPEPAGRQPF